MSISELDPANVEIGYSGAVEVAPYLVDRAGLHWDFSKVLTAVLLPRWIDSGYVPLHAAVISGSRTTLLPGGSGPGKSSVAFAAGRRQLGILASELAFIREGRLLAANSMMTIDPGAAKKFSTTPGPVGTGRLDGRETSLVKPLPPAGVIIERLAFPRACPAPLHVRPISARRARMLLFENAISQLPISQLVAHETSPVGILHTAAQLRTIVAEISPLSGLEPVIAEGHPEEIVRFLGEPARQ